MSNNSQGQLTWQEPASFNETDGVIFSNTAKFSQVQLTSWEAPSVFNKTAEIIAQYFTNKGMMVLRVENYPSIGLGYNNPAYEKLHLKYAVHCLFPGAELKVLLISKEDVESYKKKNCLSSNTLSFTDGGDCSYVCAEQEE